MTLSPQIEIMIIASVVAVTCALPGVFLILRRMALMSDAISHSILLGIVIAFFAVKPLSSPLLIIGAAVMGVITVSLTEMLVNTRKVKEDAAIGLVFPALFSIAVILISRYASKIHIDTDAVLLGEIAFAPFERVVIGGIDIGPQALWVMGIILIVNITFIALFYKELKLGTFDAGLAASLGFAPALLHYGLMGIVSITAVGAFDIVGSILVVALIIAPPSAAYLLTDKLRNMLIISALIGIASAISGYWVARIFDASIAGSMATATGLIFIITLLFAPDRGMVSKLHAYYKRRWTFATQMLVVHLLDHESRGKAEMMRENREETIQDHMNWSFPFAKKVVALSMRKGLLEKERGLLTLTPLGKETAKNIMSRT